MTRMIRWSTLALLCLVSVFAPTLRAQGVMPVPVQQFLDNNGAPINGGKVCTYASGTTTPLATYSDAALTTPRTNPVLLDTAGRPVGGGIYLSAAIYKFALRTAGSDSTCATGTVIWTQDTVSATAPWNLAIFAGKITYSAATVLTVTTNIITPTQNVHALDGAGAVNLNTIATTNVTPGFVLYLTPNNGGVNPVTVKNGLGNIQLADGSDYLLSGPTKWITLILKATTWYELGRAGAPGVTNSGLDSFRLSLTTGVCVPTADVLAAGTVYWVPCGGNAVTLYDGAQWNIRTSSQISIAVPAVANQMQDVFVYDNAGAPTLELLAWTTDVLRATAVVYQDGILVKSGVPTRRYVGSFRTTTVASQTEDSLAKRLVYNYYNRVRRPLIRLEVNATWNYSLAAYRQVNGSATNQVAAVMGIVEAPIELTATADGTNNSAAPGVLIATAIGLDGIAALLPNQSIASANSYVGSATIVTATARTYPTAGYHFYVWLEYSTAAGVTAWVGAPGLIPFTTTGLVGTVEN